MARSGGKDPSASHWSERRLIRPDWGTGRETGAKRPPTKGLTNGDLPGPAVVPVAGDDLLPFDDDRRGIRLPAHAHHLSLTRAEV